MFGGMLTQCCGLGYLRETSAPTEDLSVRTKRSSYMVSSTDIDLLVDTPGTTGLTGALSKQRWFDMFLDCWNFYVDLRKHGCEESAPTTPLRRTKRVFTCPPAPTGVLNLLSYCWVLFRSVTSP